MNRAGSTDVRLRSEKVWSGLVWGLAGGVIVTVSVSGFLILFLWELENMACHIAPSMWHVTARKRKSADVVGAGATLLIRYDTRWKSLFRCLC